MLLFLFLFGLAVATTSPSGDREVKLEQGDCPTSWYSFNGRCYKYVASRMTWAHAEFRCVSEKANLVSIHSLEEHNFVASLIRNFDPSEEATWIGLSDIHIEGRWMWSDGSAVDFAFWHKGQPDNYQGNEQCGTCYANELRWNDARCSLTSPFVCVSRTVCP